MGKKIELVWWTPFSLGECRRSYVIDLFHNPTFESNALYRQPQKISRVT
jgi:hypothetical protein